MELQKGIVTVLSQDLSLKFRLTQSDIYGSIYDLKLMVILGLNLLGNEITESPNTALEDIKYHILFNFSLCSEVLGYWL